MSENLEAGNSDMHSMDILPQFSKPVMDAERSSGTLRLMAATIDAAAKGGFYTGRIVERAHRLGKDIRSEINGITATTLAASGESDKPALERPNFVKEIGK